MVALLGDRALDAGLNALDTEANVLHICSAQPTTYAEVLSLSLGTKTLAAAGVGAPAAATPNGRKVTVAAFTDGVVSASGTAGFYAIVQSTTSRLLAAHALAAPVGVTAGNGFSMSAFDIRYPQPAT